MLSVDEEEDRDLMVRLEAEGYVINPSKYDRLRTWNYVLYQLKHTELMMGSLQERQPNLGDIRDANECSALFHFAIMAYARCFVSGLRTLDANHVFNGAQDLRSIHDELMLLQNKLVAHTLKSDAIRDAIAVKEEGSVLSILYVTTAAMPNKSQLAKYSNVIGHVQAYAHARFDQMMIDLEKKLGRQILVKDF